METDLSIRTSSTINKEDSVRAECLSEGDDSTEEKLRIEAAEPSRARQREGRYGVKERIKV